ncbi:UDP-2,4-diacetamido-2,4,6-trideoxy-beta-L-altropyranose hydrolase [Caballeronia sp. LP006]|uniref:UDP-2,4-diacetamido-2,4, 6-trideoxy-beta-L-altropyranose hydrolase n=1 Tax=Caballeronia sp. LP006 TaxID=3038552 RepID=UPI0028552A29|nr:UDP-2,4-diacetamido-2,4,6-trideoxy-beta-L-altropyranose hydrolase [Caballeronia sp. LP006]MDR5831973.1 UDP-2,4-diacetamido-2,4,6-trideoxy-beta-L-altropyranose hydrolase [Caballeronia sp. LP006]
MSALRVVFRVDASLLIGSGHVMRCLTLADDLRTRAAEVHFVTRAHAGHLQDVIRARGYSCHALAATSSPMRHDLQVSWLGCGWHQDAVETAAVLERLGVIEWLVTDHYAIDAAWERAMRPDAARILAIDDLADRPHDCDLLLDQNVLDAGSSRYSDLVPGHCVRLLGPRYALLRPQFAHERNTQMPDAGSDSRLLVFFGGVDATNETGKFLDAWCDSRPAGYVADVLVGIANPRRGDIEAMASRMAGVRVLGYVGEMAPLMARSIYAFGASGSTVWERFCVGLDSCITSVADNQRQIAQSLVALDLADYAGSWEATDARTYAMALDALDSRLQKRMERRRKIMQIVDGEGTRRVASLMLNDASGHCIV